MFCFSSEGKDRVPTNPNHWQVTWRELPSPYILCKPEVKNYWTGETLAEVPSHKSLSLAAWPDAVKKTKSFDNSNNGSREDVGNCICAGCRSPDDLRDPLLSPKLGRKGWKQSQWQVSPGLKARRNTHVPVISTKLQDCAFVLCRSNLQFFASTFDRFRHCQAGANPNASPPCAQRPVSWRHMPWTKNPAVSLSCRLLVAVRTTFYFYSTIPYAVEKCRLEIDWYLRKQHPGGSPYFGSTLLACASCQCC